MRKVYFIAGAIVSFIVLGVAYAAPNFRVERTLIPVSDKTQELGTSTKRWLNTFTKNASTTELSIFGNILFGDTSTSTISSTGTSTFQRGLIITAGGLDINLENCNGANALATDALGAIICDTDDNTGSGGGPADLVYRSLSGTKYYSASSSATDNLSFHFNNGFVSSGASSTISDVLRFTNTYGSGTSTFIGPVQFGQLPGTTLGSGLLTVTAQRNYGESTELTTDGALLINNTSNNALGLQVYTNAGASAFSPLVLLRSDNTAFPDGVLRIIQDGTCGGCYNIRLDGPAPQIEYVESDQTSPAGKFETGVNGDIYYISGRNSGDSSFEDTYRFHRNQNSNIGAFISFNTGTSTFYGPVQAERLNADDNLRIGRTATTTIRGNTSTSTFSGGLSVTGGGLLSSKGLTLTGGRLISEGTATSSFAGGILISAGGIDINLEGCNGANALATDANGAIICDTDDNTGSGSGSPNLIYRTLSTTKYYTASSSATDNLAFHFNNGFVSSASSTIAGNLQIDGLTGLRKAPNTNTALEVLTDATVNRAIRVQSGATGQISLSSFVTGDANLRFDIQADGDLEWGNGTDVVDTFLRRDGVDSLITDGVFTADYYKGISVSTSTLAGGLRADYLYANFGLNIGGTATTTLLSNATSTFNAGVSVGSGGLASSKGLSITGGVIQTSGAILSTASATSTFSSSGLSVAGGGLASSKGLTLTGGRIVSAGTATSSFAGGIDITAGGIKIGLEGCSGGNALATDAGGAVICDTDDSGGSSLPANLVYRTLSTTKYYTASSSASDNLAWHFNNGFVSSASSTIAGQLRVSDNIYLTGSAVLNASSTAHIDSKLIVGSYIRQSQIESLGLIFSGRTDGDNLLVMTSHGATPSAGVNAITSRGSAASPTASQADDILYFMGGRGYGSTAYGLTSKAAIVMKASQNWTDANQGTYITFETTDNNSTTRTEQGRLDPRGFWGVGTTSPWGQLSVEQLASQTNLKPIFVVGDTGSTSPLMFINQKGGVGIGVATTGLAQTGDLHVNDRLYANSLGIGTHITSLGSGTSTFVGGIFANDLRTNLPNCNSLDTNASGAIICGTDSGITSINGLTPTAQTLTPISDTNVTLSITGFVDDHTFEIGWSGTLAVARGGWGNDGTSTTTRASGGLNVGGGGLASSKGISLTGGILHVASGVTSTSTFDASGLTVSGGGLRSTKGLVLTGGRLISEGTATSTFAGGVLISAGGLDINLESCNGSNALATDASGTIICDTDDSGGSSNPADLIYRTLSTTKYYTASSSATDNLSWHFANGFVSSGASSTISDTLRLTGTTLLSDGTAAAPSLAFISDTDNGIFRRGVDTWGFSGGGTERLTVDSTGYVGVGTTTPWGQFAIDQLANQTKQKPIFVIGDNGTTTPFFFVNQKGGISFGTDNIVATNGSVVFGNRVTLPNSTNPTVDATGQTALNTLSASTSLRFYDGTAERSLFDTHDRAFSFASSTLIYSGSYGTAGTTTILLANFYRPVTLVSFFCKADVGQAHVNFTDGTNITDTVRCTTTGRDDDGSIANNTWTMREDFKISIGTQSSNPNFITVTATIREDSD